MIILRFFIFVISLIYFIKSEIEMKELTLQNYDSLISKFDYSFLLFYTNWCNHCKVLLEETMKVSKHYQSYTNVSILFAKINGVLEKDLLEKYDIGEYPTIRFLINKTSFVFTGGRTSKEIIQWIEAKTTKTTTELIKKEQMDEMISNHEFLILYVGKNNYKFDNFLHVSRIIDGETFCHTFNEELRLFFF